MKTKPLRYGATPKPLLLEFKNRTTEALKTGVIEKGVRDICAAFHAHEHFTSMWACQGHGLYSKKRYPGCLHVVLAATQQGLPFLDEIMYRLEKEDMSAYWDLSVSRLMFPQCNIIDPADFTIATTYPAWKLGYRGIINEPELRIVRKVLLTTVNNVLHGK